MGRRIHIGIEMPANNEAMVRKTDALLKRVLEVSPAFRHLQGICKGAVGVALGSGPSAYDERVPHDVLFAANAAWQYIGPSTAISIGCTFDGAFSIYNGSDPCSYYALSIKALEHDHPPHERVIHCPNEMPIRGVGAQPWMVWLARLLGIKKLHLYGCDSAFGSIESLYTGRFALGTRRNYLKHPILAAAISQGMPLYWHAAGKTMTKKSIEPTAIRYNRKWEG